MSLNSLAEFVGYRTYQRWVPDLGRRETWEEAVDRLREFYVENSPSTLHKEVGIACDMIERKEIMPSMRLLWSAGEAASTNPVAAYNCSFQVMDSVTNFADLMFILMSGTGAGVSVERQYTEKLPSVSNGTLFKQEVNYSVDDSKEGWANSVRVLMAYLYGGHEVHFDYSRIRPHGARLNTMGGQASGYEPLKELHEFIVRIFKGAEGRRLRPIEVSDIVNKMGSVVVVGGVRRSAIIVLFDPDDEEMMMSKSGPFWEKNPQRALSNISVAYRTPPTKEQFQRHWEALRNSGTGEPGFFQSDPTNRRNVLGTNPCGEILLRNREFCNLSEVVVRSNDTFGELHKKVTYATLLGTIQSSLTNFPYIHRSWKENCDEERLLGVSLTGIQDRRLDHETLGRLRTISHYENRDYARKMGIATSEAVTCVKPSGTVSQLVDSSSGIHDRFAEYYIRRVRINAADPLCKVLEESGVPLKIEVGDNPHNPRTKVVEFYVKSPITPKHRTALQQLHEVFMFNKNWCDHNTSCTIYVEPHEWDLLGDFCWNNMDKMNGVSFLPKSDHIYELAPYEEITKEQFEAHRPVEIDYSLLKKYEHTDNTVAPAGCESDKCDATWKPNSIH